jgi:GNAT superfamily N-acetyltransferase
MKVRRARQEDAGAIARVHLETWRAGYEHVFGRERLARLSEQLPAREARWKRNLEDTSATTFVAEVNGVLVGFASVGAAREEDDPAAGELWALYVLPAHWGRGAGRALLAAATEHLRALGHGEAMLWVLADNPRARRFYERCGWRWDGGLKAETHLGLEVEEVRYRRSL